jgi:hypothetical protein
MKRSMDDLLRDTLLARAADPTAACLDPETAAAFVEGTMSRRERAGAEAHVADCPRCQAVLAALVRSTPPPIERAWWRRPAVAWLVPATVAAAAVAIWINVPDTARVHPVQTLRDAAPPIESLPIQSPPTVAPDAPQAQPQIGSLADARPVASDAFRVREASASAKTLARATPGLDALQGAAASQPQAAPPPAVAEPQPARADAAPPVGPNVERVIVAQPARPAALAETVTVSGSAAVVAVSTTISSNGVSQWRIGVGGAVQHSADRGATWRSQATGANVTLAAGSSPSPSVCWLVGPGGLVVITTDAGQSWRRVPFPLMSDLASVRATNESTATIVTSDGRTLVTSDGGRNWRP